MARILARRPGFSKDWKNQSPVFQALENFAAQFPSLGTSPELFSKAWKRIL
jgi:hypothetical protein